MPTAKVLEGDAVVATHDRTGSQDQRLVSRRHVDLARVSSALCRG